MRKRTFLILITLGSIALSVLVSIILTVSVDNRLDQVFEQLFGLR